MIQTSRRSFLGGLVASAASPLFAAVPAFNPFERVALGKTGIRPTRLGFGTGVNSNNRSSALLRKHGVEGATRLIRAAYDEGIRFFDLADSYGSHALMPPALQGLKRDDYVLGTKYWWASGGIPESDHTDVTTSIERFLRELHTDYIDFVELHCVSSPNWIKDLDAQRTALAKAKKAGKIRAHGCSFHSYSALAAATADSWMDLAHIRLNPYGRNMSTHPERVLAKVREFHAAGKGVIAMKVLGVGSLAQKPGGIDRSLTWNLTSGCVDTLSIGFTELAEIKDIATRIRAIARA